MNFMLIYFKIDCLMFWYCDIFVNVFSYKIFLVFVVMLYFLCYSFDLVSFVIEVI